MNMKYFLNNLRFIQFIQNFLQYNNYLSEYFWKKFFRIQRIINFLLKINLWKTINNEFKNKLYSVLYVRKVND